MQERNLKDIYNQYLLSKNEHHTAVRYKDKSWYHSSAAGLCARKHFFSSVSQVEGTPVDEKTQRIFRLGNLVHEDIQDALTWYSQIHGLPLLIEKEIYLEDLNVRGYIDLALIDMEGDLTISLYSETTLTFSKKTAFILSFQSQTDKGK